MKKKIEVRHYINDIIVQLFSPAAEYKCKFENNVSPEIKLVTDTEAFLFILNRLLKLIIQSSYNSSICISDVYDGDKLSIIIKDDNNDYRAFISGKMEKHQSIIRKAGCQLSFEFNEKKNITVILCFANNQTDRAKG